jgi:protein O-mannosyl-transferase
LTGVNSVAKNKTFTSVMISYQPLLKKYAVILIAIIGILAYANSFNNAFQFDDGYHIVDGAKIKNFDNVLKASHWKAIGNRPFAFFTLAVNYQLNKLNVTGYHIANLLFHILAGFMAFLLTLEIMSLEIFKKNKIINDYKVLIALFTAFIFIAHPIQTQAVTYIIQRMTVLAGFFYMWAVLLYIRGRKAHLQKQSVRKWKPYALYAGAFIAGIFGFLSKQNAVTFPLAFILAEVFFIRDDKQKIDRKFLFVLSSIVGLIILLGLLINGLPAEYDKISRSEYLFTQFRVLVKYWQLLFLPVNQHLDYFFMISMTLWGINELLSLLFLLLTIALGVWLFRKNWIIPSFAIFWFYLTLSLESSIIPIRDVIFEHRLYSATFGFAFGISYLAFYFLSSKNLKYPVIALSILTLVYVGASLNRNRVWKNPYTLWSDSVKKSPKRERAWYWLATYYMTEKDNENALKCYDTSIKCNPRFPLAYNGRGNLKKTTGDLQGAVNDYDKAITIDPAYITAYYNRGIAYAALDKLDEAIKDYDKSVSLGNTTAAVYYNRANAERRNKDYTAAIEDYNTALKIDPSHALSYFNRGLTKAKLEKHQEAIKDIDLAINLDPKNHLFYNGKGVSLIALGNYQEAISNFSACLKINPDFGQAYYNRGYAKQTGLGDKEGACKDWEIASSKGYKGADHYLQQYCK